MSDKALIIGAIVLGTIVVEWLRAKAYQNGRLAGIREAVHDLSRSCSFHYEKKGEALPKKVDEALDYIGKALNKSGTSERIEFYLIGAGMLGDAMGDAAATKGFEAGRQWVEPKDGEIRVDLSPQEILDLAFMAHLGFARMIHEDHLSFSDRSDAERATHAIERLERHRPNDRVDGGDRYAQAFNRSTMIWERFSNTARG